jgi:transcriptional regulator GlxA family with amidase domain
MMATQEPKTVAFVLYPGFTLLDLVGPLQVFASLRQFNDQYRRWWWPSGSSPWPPTARSR